MHEAIRVGEMTVTFLKTRQETGGKLDLFELTIPSQASVIVPHLHRDHDEVIFGMDGVVTFWLDGKRNLVSHGDKLSIPRGTVHSFANLRKSMARIMCLHTPGELGPEYFYEIAAYFNTGCPPDVAGIGEVMLRYGVIPSTHERQLTGVAL